MTASAKTLKKFTPADGSAHPTILNEFCVEKANSGGDRICFTSDTANTNLFLKLTEAMAAPFQLLYVLLISRKSNHDVGRYQSPELSRPEMMNFLSTHSAFLEQDGRHNLWIHSATDGSTLVYDRHEIGYAYGNLQPFKPALLTAGLKEVKKQPGWAPFLTRTIITLNLMRTKTR